MAWLTVSILLCVAACGGEEKPPATAPAPAQPSPSPSAQPSPSPPAQQTPSPDSPESVAEVFMAGLQNADMAALWDVMSDAARASVAEGARMYVDGLFPGCGRALHEQDRATLDTLSDRDIAVLIAATNMQTTPLTWTVGEVTLDANTTTVHVTAGGKNCELDVEHTGTTWRTDVVLRCYGPYNGPVGITRYRVSASHRPAHLRIVSTEEGFDAYDVLRPGDVILSVDGNPVMIGTEPTLPQLVAASEGKPMRMMLLRDYKDRIEVTVAANTMPDSTYRLGISWRPGIGCGLH